MIPIKFSRISLVCPLYKPDLKFLREMIDSIEIQNYPNYEICFCDDGSASADLLEFLKRRIALNSRIRFSQLWNNGGISAATNHAAKLATGQYLLFIDQDDRLSLNALWKLNSAITNDPADFYFSDEDKQGNTEDPAFETLYKPDFGSEQLISRMIYSHVTVIKKTLFLRLGGLRTPFNGSQDMDLLLRVAEATKKIVHIPEVLYHWRVHQGSTSSSVGVKSYARFAGMDALAEAGKRRNTPWQVTSSSHYYYRVRRIEMDQPLISILMPTRDHSMDVERAISSVFRLSTYKNFELILVDNGSTENALESVVQKWKFLEPKRFRSIHIEAPFNFSYLNNQAAKVANGEFLLMLNNDTEALTPNWIENMLQWALDPEVGAVGAKLLFADGMIQHAGVIVGIGGHAGHSHRNHTRRDHGYIGRLRGVSNYSSVSAACLMVRKSIFDQVNGLDEQFAVAFNDVDFCLRMQALGYRNVWTPFSSLFHFESKSRGVPDTIHKIEITKKEIQLFRKRWMHIIHDDPYYHQMLSPTFENFSFRPGAV